MTVDTRISQAAATAGAQPQPGEWLALHIYYAANPATLLTHCVAPLVRELRARGLVYRYFFIRYWLEGPHLRLRLRPTHPDDAEEVRGIAEAAVEDFLRRRPAVYSMEHELTADLYKQMFLAEYSQEEWDARYGTDGTMPIRPNNSYAYVEYEPEYDRYGGPAGVELAEWHFEKSSDTVLRLLETTNVHVRTVLFGLSAQLTLTMCYTFLGDSDTVARWLQNYFTFWERSYMEEDPDRHEMYDKAYADTASTLSVRAAEIGSAVVGGHASALASFAKGWAEHCRELRDRVVSLVDQRQLIFQAFQDPADVPAAPEQRRRPATDSSLALRILLTSYVHMTNNRLGLNVHDEVYLAYLLRRSVMDGTVGDGGSQ